MNIRTPKGDGNYHTMSEAGKGIVMNIRTPKGDGNENYFDYERYGRDRYEYKNPERGRKRKLFRL